MNFIRSAFRRVILLLSRNPPNSPVLWEMYARTNLLPRPALLTRVNRPAAATACVFLLKEDDSQLSSDVHSRQEEGICVRARAPCARYYLAMSRTLLLLLYWLTRKVNCPDMYINNVILNTRPALSTCIHTYCCTFTVVMLQWWRFELDKVLTIDIGIRIQKL